LNIFPIFIKGCTTIELTLKSRGKKLKRKRRYKRGYPIAVLIGFHENRAVFWNIFSQVAKKSKHLNINGKRNDDKTLYNFHESIIENIKPSITEGVRSFVLVSPPRTDYSQQFLDHTTKHHRYLIQSKNPNCANFAQLIGTAEDSIQVSELVKTKEFTNLIEKTTSEEADQVVNNLEKHLYASNNSVVLYSLKEIEDYVYKKKKNINEVKREHLLLTDVYLSKSRQKQRIYRLLQIAKNKKIKTKVVDADTSAGSRITQFGGLVFFNTK